MNKSLLEYKNRTIITEIEKNREKREKILIMGESFVIIDL